MAGNSFGFLSTARRLASPPGNGIIDHFFVAFKQKMINKYISFPLESVT